MKTKITLLFIATLLIASCSKLEHHHGHHGNDGDGDGGKDDTNKTEYSRSQVVVRYEKGLNESEKAVIRDSSKIQAYETCSCGDKDIELWNVNDDFESVELTVERLRRGPAAEGDLLFDFALNEVKGFETTGAPGQMSTSSFIFDFPSDQVNIAIIDSGIDFGKSYTSDSETFTPYLYFTSGMLDCSPDSPSGWNFTDEGEHNDVLDLNGHGSTVAKIITNKLNESNTKFSILPVKAFTEEGKSSYWNIVCAFGYLQKIQADNRNLDIINASFGALIDASLYHEDNLLNSMIKELSEMGVTVVTSAGNEGVDTDTDAQKHIPSGFIADNIVGVGGYTIDPDFQIHADSNYGIKSIDVAAPYSWNLPKFGVLADGSSFSTAYISAILAGHIIENDIHNTLELKNKFLDGSFGTVQFSNTLSEHIQNGAYVKLD